MSKIKVFIVEDSILMQKIIADILLSDPGIEVVGSTKYGKEALKKIPELKPDIVTLDFNLPDINGLIVLTKLMQYSPVRVVMLSAHTQKGAEITMKALEMGALDFIPKPSGEVSLDLFNFKDEIIAKIKLLVTIPLKKSIVSGEIVPSEAALSVKKLVIIGASTGGPKAIIDLLNSIPANIEAGFLIVQHMPEGFTKSFAERLSWHSALKVKESEDGDLILNGAAYVAASGYHMILERIAEVKNRYCLRLDETPLVNYLRPAVDVTMSSVADSFDGDIVGVILTGMGKDGLEGVKQIKNKGAKVIVQDETTCTVYGMPKVVADNGLADSVLPLSEIPERISEYLNASN